MSGLNLGDGEISHRQQIVQLLKMAIEQKWDFSHLSTVGKRVSTNELHLVSVNTRDGVFTVAGGSIDPQRDVDKQILFRGHSGGISIMFNSRLADESDTNTAGSSASVHQFKLPYKVRCTQLRKTVRVNLEDLEEVPVVLYMVNGALVEGVVVDISTSGARFRVHRKHVQDMANPNVVDACKVTLGQDFVLQCGLQLIGIMDDEIRDMSYLRCQFTHMKLEDVKRLESYIEDMLMAGGGSEANDGS